MLLLYITLITCLGIDGSVQAPEDGNIPPAPPVGPVVPYGHISGGYNVVKQTAPWHAGIYKKTTKPYMQICGGTVVTLNAVITAAHCFSLDGHIPSASNYAVAAGKIYRPWNDPHDEQVQKSDVKEIKVPPRYQGSIGNFQDDIAVVLVVTEFYYSLYVAPACLNFNFTFDEIHLRDEHFGQVVGWGLTGENSPSSQVLQEAPLPTVAIEKCIEQSPVSFRSYITGDKICAGYYNGDVGSYHPIFNLEGGGGVPSISYGHRVESPTIFPWHAGLYTKTSEPYKQICGGTILAKHIVISAAHCFSLDINITPASNFAVATGKIYRPWNDPQDKEVQKSDVKEVKIPPRYQGALANYQDDIALLILTKDFVFNLYVQPACVNFDSYFDEAQLKAGQLGKVAGWGLTDENSEESSVLQSATLPIVAIDKCIEQSPANFTSSVTSDKICAGYNNGTAVCRGDSGGGLVFIAKWKLLEVVFLRGVASTAPSSTVNKCNIYTWATFTHLLKHKHFLKSVVPDIEKSCMLPSNQGIPQTGYGKTQQNNTCSRKIIKLNEVDFDGNKFCINLSLF